VRVGERTSLPTEKAEAPPDPADPPPCPSLVGRGAESTERLVAECDAGFEVELEVELEAELDVEHAA